MLDRIAFPGKSSFPLSPSKEANRNGTMHISKQDQMYLILKMLGKQSENEISFITDQNVIDFIASLEKGIQIGLQRKDSTQTL